MHATILLHPLAIHNQLAFRIYICYNQIMEKTYSRFDEIKDQHLRFTIEGLAKLYYGGDVEAALKEYNEIDQFLNSIQTTRGDESFHVQIQF